MIWSSLKWGIPLLLIVVIAASLLTKKTFRIEHTVAAPPEVVWQVLLDTATYSEWNPVFVKVDRAYAEGETVVNTVRDPSGKLTDMKATVRTVAEGRELRQSGGLPGVITFDHRWLLEPTEGGTLVVQDEIDRGFGLWFWNSDWIEPAYTETSKALGERAEALAQ